MMYCVKERGDQGHDGQLILIREKLAKKKNPQKRRPKLKIHLLIYIEDLRISF